MTLEHALAYTERGLAVVPLHTPVDAGCSCRRPDCPSPGKHPRVRWQRYQAEAPTVDEVRQWWTRWPDANLGVLTGTVSGIVVLDVDPRHGGDAHLVELEAEVGPLPPTPTVTTGGGGQHLWFRAPAAPVPTGPLAPGLDLEAEGAIVVVPPSRHASGRTYAWQHGLDDVALADLPPGVADRSWGHRPARPPSPPPLRTDQEQQDFIEAWWRAGVAVEPGDRYYRCPFHPDRHPSLHVDTEGCRWFCFGCRRGGGIGALRHELGEAAPPRPRRRLHSAAPGATGVVTLPGEVEVDVVGESLHQDALLAATGGRRSYGGVEVPVVAALVPDPDDPRDPDAITVTVAGERVGWLGAEDAGAWRPAIDGAIADHGVATCRGVIRGGWDRGHGDLGAFGIVVFLP